MKQLIALIGVIMTLAACGSRAFYHPGSLEKSGTSLSLPDQEGVEEGFWKMEEGILLYHFEHGQGRPVLVIQGGPGVPPDKSWEGLQELDKDFRFIYYHQRGCGSSTRPVE